jgi:CRP-like cAMP-binding protein
LDLLDRALALSRSPVIATLTPGAVVALAEHARAIEIADGAAVAVPAESVLVVARGDVALAGGAAAGAGTMLGLVAALAGGAAETGIARGEVVAIAALRDELLDLIAEHPPAVRALTAQLAARVRGASGP